MIKNYFLLVISVITLIGSYTNIAISQTIDVGVANISPMVVLTDSSIQCVTIEVYNNGQIAFSNIPLWYKLNGGNAVWDTVVSTILPGDTIGFTFAQQVTVPGWLDISFICVYADCPGDTNLQNDVVWWNHNPYGATCAGGFPYGQPNSPMMPGELHYAYDSDIWSFELLDNFTNVTVSLCGSSFDTRLDVYHNCLSSYIGSNDDYCGLHSLLFFTYLSAGTYYAMIHGFSVAYGTYLINITGTPAPPPPVLELMVTNVSCNGADDGAIDLTVNPIPGMTPPYIYQWSNGQTNQDLTNIPAGTYFVTLIDSYGTYLYDSAVVSEPEPLLFQYYTGSPSCSSCNDGFIQTYVIGGVPPYSWLWSNGETSQHLMNTNPGDYYLTVTDNTGCTLTDTISLYIPGGVTQMIILPSGWSIFSTNINPLITAIDNITIPISQNLIIIKDHWGHTYWPEFGVNSIGNLNLGLGYQIKLLNTDTLIVSGNPIEPQTQLITLQAQWSIIGYLRNSPGPISQMLSTIITNVLIVKNGNGDVFLPAYGVNLIGDMEPGQGYQIKMMATDVLIYPPN